MSEKKYCLLATEGPHDQAALGRLLQLCGFKKFNGDKKNLDQFWEGFVPKYPKGGDLYKRMDMPSIFDSTSHSVAVYCGEGSKLIQNLEAITTNHTRYKTDVYAFGLIVDADKDNPINVAREKAQALRTMFTTVLDTPGVVNPGDPRTGIYILPDNKRTGVLDSILVECASIVYPEHKDGALNFINGLSEAHTRHLNMGARDKATVACITSILQPGQTNTSSIAKDKWISDKTVGSKNIASLLQFVKDLLSLEAPDSASI